MPNGIAHGSLLPGSYTTLTVGSSVGSIGAIIGSGGASIGSGGGGSGSSSPVYYTTNGTSNTLVTITDLLNTIIARLDEIEKTLKIINVDEALCKKYPGLDSAYDQYQLIKNIVSDA